MRAFLYGTSAFSFWLTATSDISALDHASTRLFKELEQCRPTQETLDYLDQLFPFFPRPYELLVPQRTVRTPEGAVTHASTYPLGTNSFYRVADGVYVVAPELCFVQLARTLCFHELALAGNALCGTFALDPSSDCLLERRPLTSTRKLSGFIAKNPGLPGIKHTRAVLPFLIERTASPPESFLSMLLTLPHRHGGYALPDLKANQVLKVSRKAQAIAGRKTLIPDLCHLASRLTIEYDSNAEHMTSRQIARDAAKRLALEADRYKVITVTARQLGSRNEMKLIAEQAAHHLGLRLRLRSKNFDREQNALFRCGWHLARYLQKPASS